MDKWLNKIHQGNCADLMQEIPEDSIDLTVTSPPYDDLRTYKGYSFDFRQVAWGLERVTKPGGVVVWVVGDQVKNGSETGTSFRQALGFMDMGFRLHDTMIYEKAAPAAPSGIRYSQIFEYMFIFSKGRPATFNPIEDRKNKWEHSFGKRSRRNKNGELIKSKMWKRTKSHGTRFNIWRYAVGKGFSTKDESAFDHPAIFPEKLARDHILSWSNPGDIVLDPMCGSGTTLKMAQEAGRSWIGIDISEEYCELSRKRMKAAKVPLFV